MKRKSHAGITSVSLPIFVTDTSSAAGAGLGGLVFGTVGLVAEYRRQGQATWTTITLVAGTLGTYTNGGLIADGALAGAYEFCPPNAALATGARWVAIRLYGATNMKPVLIEIELDAVDYQDAAVFGLSAIPNALPGAANGLFIAGTNATTTANITGNLSGSVGSVTGNVGGDVAGKVLGGGAGAIAGAGVRADQVTGAVASVTGAVGSVTGNVGGNVVGSVASVVAAVTISTTQVVPTSNTANTVGDALNAARAQGFGKWVVDTAAKTLTIYAPDATTIVRQFTLDSVTAPTQRV